MNLTKVEIRHSVQNGTEKFYMSVDGAPEKEISKEQYLYLANLLHSDEDTDE